MNKVLRCAIYTRKSTEEGLDQAFNSLHAQREACEAFIKSQAHEGWKQSPSHFDDGGFSGGTLERPALARLLEQVKCGTIHVIVVYKIDRLTRSLADFARIVEVLDGHAASFVSVTQQFNTTTSMGRLTLNVLLSFAQFEREVTGERIRDKIAASKGKGMWMGGPPPLGYDVRDRKLLVNANEAECVREIYARYLELKSVTELAVDLKARGVCSKSWISRKGVRHDGGIFSRGALYKVLRNRLYVGEVAHRGRVFPGQHEGIVSRDLWDRVNQQLTEGGLSRTEASATTNVFLLQGLLHDDRGNLMSPSNTTKRNGRQYRYYVSQGLIRKEKVQPGTISRVPAQEIESLVEQQVIEWMTLDSQKLWKASSLAEKRTQIGRWLRGVELHREDVVLLIDAKRTESLAIAERVSRAAGTRLTRRGEVIELKIPAILRKVGGAKEITTPPGCEPFIVRVPNPGVAKAIARAFRWRHWLETGEVATIGELAKKAGFTQRIVRKNLPLAFLAPYILKAVLDGQIPSTVSISNLTDGYLPLSWAEQRRRLGIA
ncbi:MAG: recombinase family protein [Bdellovibrionia bacterium]